MMMRNCVICQSFSGRMEICYECALMLWPHREVNPGAKQLSTRLMPVPDLPVPSLAGGTVST
jgi:hypothetical protein